MNTDSKQTNYRCWAIGSTLLLIILSIANITFLTKHTWRNWEETRYVQSARTAIQKISVLENELTKADKDLAGLTEVNTQLRKENHEMFMGKEQLAADLYTVLVENKKKSETLCSLNCEVIRLEWTSAQSAGFKPDDLATRLLACPLGGQYILKETNRAITCSHAQTSLATSLISTP